MTMVNNAYALNRNVGSSNYNDCDIYLLADNVDEDSAVTLEQDQTLFTLFGIIAFKIRLHNSNLVLTAMNNGRSGEDVRWVAETTSFNSKQLWKFIDVTTKKPANSNKVDTLLIFNQQWDGFTEPGIYYSGCALCCGAAVSSYYSGLEINPQNLPFTKITLDSGYPGVSYSWSSPYATMTEVANPTFAQITSEINAGRPVILHAVTASKEHWVVAYAFKGSASGNIASATDRARILVYDTFNEGGEANKYGVGRTLDAAMNLNLGTTTYTIDRCKFTSAK